MNASCCIKVSVIALTEFLLLYKWHKLIYFVFVFVCVCLFPTFARACFIVILWAVE
jgi:hypothetical protein